MEWRRLLPKYWVQLEKTDWAWDKKLNELLDSNPTITLGYLTVFLNNAEIWVGNYPYSYGQLYTPARGSKATGVPSIKTRNRIKDIVDRLEEKERIRLLNECFSKIEC